MNKLSKHGILLSLCHRATSYERSLHTRLRSGVRTGSTRQSYGSIAGENDERKIIESSSCNWPIKKRHPLITEQPRFLDSDTVSNFWCLSVVLFVFLIYENMRKTSSSHEPLHESLVRVSSLGSDLFSRRVLKKGNKNINTAQTNLTNVLKKLFPVLITS